MPFKFITDITDKITGFFKLSAENTVNHISKWGSHGRLGGLISYRAADFEELVKIRLHFSQYIDTVIDPILDINLEKNIPKASSHEISVCFIFEKNKNRGDLRSLMEYLSILIRVCVNARFSTIVTKGYDHINGAAILCCAEIAKWVNAIAKSPIDEIMLKTVSKRIQYLESLLEADIFQNEPKTDYSLDRLFFNLIAILEKLVKPQIQAELTERSAREYFKALVTESKTVFQDISSGLNSLYSNQSKDVTDLYNVEASSFIVHQAYEKSTNSQLGLLFQNLSKYYQQNLNFTAFNQLITDCKDNNQENLLNELKDPKKFKENGVHLLIYKKPELIDHLIAFVDLLKQFALLIITFRQSYALAGDGGDMLIYLGLCQEISSITACYFQLRGQLQQQISDIFKLASEIMSELIQNQEKSPWRQQYLGFKKQLETVKTSLEICDIQINNILVGMMRVSAKDYAEEVQDKIENLRKTLDLIQYKLGIKNSLPHSTNVTEIRDVKIEELSNSSENPQLGYSNVKPREKSVEALIARQQQQHLILQQRLASIQRPQLEDSKAPTKP